MTCIADGRDTTASSQDPGSLRRRAPCLAGRTASFGPAREALIAPKSCNAGCMDLEVSPALTIPTSELSWRFSRSSGPGGQHVNTSDSRVELSWNVAGSAALSEGQRLMLVTRLGRRLIAGVLTVTASERRSQLRNRELALAKLSALVAEGLAPGAARRRATKPTRGSNRRRLAAKEQRSATKRQRKRPTAE
jgi:ribosome-associated protein